MKIISLSSGKSFSISDHKLLCIELTKKDKENIANMAEDATLYVEFDTDMYSADEVDTLIKDYKEKYSQFTD